MPDLSACYFCGTAMDAPLEEYPVVPEELNPGDEQATAVLCPTCHEKLTTVLERVVAAAETEAETGDQSVQSSLAGEEATATGAATDPDSFDSPDDFDADPDEIIDSVEEGPEAAANADTASADAGASAADDTAGTDATAADDTDGGTAAGAGRDGSPVTAGADSHHEPIFDVEEEELEDETEDETVFGSGEETETTGATPESGPNVESEPNATFDDPDVAGEEAVERTDDSEDGTDEAEDDGTEPTDGAETVTAETGTAEAEGDEDAGSTATSMGPSSETYNRVVRLLQNREFPVERDEIREAAISAYEISPAEFDAVIDSAVEQGVIDEDDGMLRLPGA